MIKKNIFILCFLLYAYAVHAEVVLSPTIQEARAHRAELVQKQDEMLELLLEIPFEQRQYIFPLLSAKQSVPKKIKTHPEVLLWKGKRPTRIADRFKEDKELIEFLPEQFYYFLSPDMWPSTPGQGSQEMNPNQILQNLTKEIGNSELSVMPEELVDIYSGLNILQKWVQEQAKQPQMPLYFEKWVKKAPQKFKDQIVAKTGLSMAEFGVRVDNIAKSYRSYQNQKIPPVSPEQQLVQEYWSLVPFIFQKAGFSEALKPEFYQD